MADEYENVVVAPEQPINSVSDPAATGAADLPDEPIQARTFTQDELDDIVEKRLSKERRKVERLQRDSDISAAIAQDRQTRSHVEATEPALEQFDTYEKYIEAKTDFVVDQKLKAHIGQMQAQAQRTHEAQGAEAAWQAKVADASRTYADFSEVVYDQDLQITPTMSEAIRSSDVGMDLAYYLGKHPQEAARIAELGGVQQFREIVKLEGQLPKRKTVSNAAAPIQAVRGSGSGGSDIYEAGISSAEYMRRRSAQLKAG